MLPLIPLFTNSKERLKITFILIFVSLFSYIMYLFLLGHSQFCDFYNNFDKTYVNLSINIIKTNLLAALSWIKSYFPLLYILLPFALFYFLLQQGKTFVIVFWTFFPIIISVMFGKYFFPRYLLPSIVFLFLILAVFLNKMFSGRKIFLIVLFLIPSIIFDYYILFDPPNAFYHYNEGVQFISEWPSGYGVIEAYNKLSSLGPGSKIFVEGDNGNMFSYFKLLGARFDFKAFFQNMSENEIIKQANYGGFNYVIINRKSAIIHQDLKPIWSYIRPFNGDKIILYEYSK